MQVPQNGYERGFAVVAMVAGTWSYAYCITTVVDQVSNMNAAEVRFKQHQDSLLEYMNARNLPHALQKRILSYYDFQRKHAAVFHKCDSRLLRACQWCPMHSVLCGRVVFMPPCSCLPRNIAIVGLVT